MRYAAARQGRVFVVRLEDGDIVHEQIEALARTEGLRAAALLVVGAADAGSRLVAGPATGRETPIRPTQITLEGVHEIAGVGTLFPDENGTPRLHLHMACGRGEATRTGCARSGVRVWHVMEAILWELVDTSGVRRVEPATGFALLQP